MEYIAHISEYGRIHTLHEHLMRTAKLAGAFAFEFDSREWGYLCGLWHDFGKYSEPFQTMIKAAHGMIDDSTNIAYKVNHSTAGALWAIEKFGPLGRIFSYPIAGHHAGLADWQADETGNAALFVRLKENKLLELVKKENIPPEILDYPLPKNKPPQGADPAFWIRMLFSCLVDADFLDTESFLSLIKQSCEATIQHPKVFFNISLPSWRKKHQRQKAPM